ncbi:MAG: NADH-quinone oxidoreductase subunit NuoK [Cyanobacteriota bacterium]
MELLYPDLIHYLILAAILFIIGLYGLFTSRNAIRVLMCVELLLNSVNINMVAFANYVDPNLIRGDIFALFIMAVAAAEAAVAFAIVLAIYRNRSTVDMEDFDTLKW